MTEHRLRGLTRFATLVLIAGATATLAPASQRHVRSDALSGARGSFAKGVEVTVVRGGQVRARVTARSIRESHLRLFGPFRLGLAPSLEVDHLSIEIFASMQEGAGRSDGHEIAHAVRSLQVPTGIATLYAAPARIVIQRKDGSQIAIRAARCSLSPWAKEVTCQKAVVEDGDKSFRAVAARFDGSNWRFRGKRPLVADPLGAAEDHPRTPQETDFTAQVGKGVPTRAVTVVDGSVD